jgi:hypothetical protein
MTPGIISKQYQELARAIIHQAVMDAQEDRIGRMVSKNDHLNAIEFLANSAELEYLADLAECIPDMERAGYLKKGEYL